MSSLAENHINRFDLSEFEDLSVAASDNDYAASDNRRRNARAEKGHPSLTLDVPSLYNERISTHRQCIALVVDVEAKVDELALHVATERLNYELKRGNFFKKAWKHLSEEVYRQRYMAEERTDIVRQIRNIQGADLGATSNTSQRFSNNERLAILERFNAGLCDSDESRRGLSSSLGSALEAKLKELMINYRNGKIDRQGFVDEKSKLFGEKSPVIDNLAEIADQLNVNQIRSLEFVHAQASGSIKEVDHLTVFDRAFNSLKKIPVFGQLLSPIPAAVAFCSLTFVFEGTARRLVPIGALVLGGVLAAWKRRLAVTHDVAHQRRAQTAGFKSANKAYGMFEQIDALDLASSLREIREDGLDGSDKVSLENSERLLGARRGQKRPAGASSLEQAIDLIAKVEAHAHIGRQVKHDLIQYAGPGTVEQNRLELLQEVAEMKVAIRESEANLYLANGVIRELGKYWYDEISKKIESFESDFKGYRRR
ncbi:MAG: hypothetical protein KDD42_05970, partial [Bdellovibrionales bacterium]|nr:hypothetical protein [Bdellovibrionales bacterium]